MFLVINLVHTYIDLFRYVIICQSGNDLSHRNEFFVLLLHSLFSQQNSICRTHVCHDIL